jgi:hypothetical protein
MNRYRRNRKKAADDAVTLLLFLLGPGWFIGWTAAGGDRVAGRDATPNFSLAYGFVFLWTALPARWWRYAVGMPRTLRHGLVWAYFAHHAALLVAVLAWFVGAVEMAETALLLLAVHSVLVQVALWWQQRIPAAHRA